MGDYYYDIDDDMRDSTELPSSPRETFYISSYQRSLSWASTLSSTALETASTSKDDNSDAFLNSQSYFCQTAEAHESILSLS